MPVAPGGHKSRIDIVPIDYVLAALEHVIEHEPALGATLNLCDPFALTVREMLDLLCGRLGILGPVLDIPAKPLGSLLRSEAFGPLRAVLDQALNLPPELLAGLARPAVFDTSTAESILRPAGIELPPVVEYIDPIVEYARRRVV